MRRGSPESGGVGSGSAWRRGQLFQVERRVHVARLLRPVPAGVSDLGDYQLLSPWMQTRWARTEGWAGLSRLAVLPAWCAVTLGPGAGVWGHSRERLG